MSDKVIPNPRSVSAERVAKVEEDKVEAPVEQVSSAIKVVALRPGFWANMRKVAGDEFEVPSLEMVGMWMKCVDPKVRALHEKFLKDKKKPAGI